MKFVTHRDKCRGCNSSSLLSFLNLGKVPLAGNFLKSSKSKSVILPLKIFICQDCFLMQVLDIVNPDLLFQEYKYSSSTIPSLKEHFKEYAVFLKKKYLSSDSSLLEFGCNDGVLLDQLSSQYKAYGIDPSVNITDIARKKSLSVITGYFNTKTAKTIKKRWGLMDVVTGSNVFAHIDNVDEVLRAVSMVLKQNGVFIVEVHYGADLIKDLQYDFFYHEHLSYYTLTSLQKMFSRAGFTIFDAQRISIHGGSIRVVARFELQKKLSPQVKKLLSEERNLGINKVTTYLKFAEQVAKHKKSLIALLNKIKRQGKRIVGYGASGRSVTLLNYCKIDHTILDYIVDVSPLRVGLYIPGVYIKINPLTYLRKDNPDYIFITAWSYLSSIRKQENELINKGVKLIVPLPKIEIM